MELQSNVPLKPFNIFPSVTEAFLPDIVHDVVEGVIPLLLKLILKSFIIAKYFNLNHCNDLLVNFVFGQYDVKCNQSKFHHA